ncbi:hypothetical protein X474_04910 [Dethiosulfatarculus sandiegensis]|uniref:Uncharacterized protein n=1 Tax=Dethiosulfatarculus sandiegensis TaxID=1429043 RepID=A0A0D2JAQ1_9BACT|nr:hypothetical protein X474_04910 [Dethiosulfatarculus sandiegensis]
MCIKFFIELELADEKIAKLMCGFFYIDKKILI